MGACVRWISLSTLFAGVLASCVDDVGDVSGAARPPVVKDAGNDVSDASDDRRDGRADARDARDATTRDVFFEAPSQLLSKRSAECAACANASCSMEMHSCEVLSGIAVAGPAKGLPRSELCAETMACVLKTGCANNLFSACYCEDSPTTVREPELCQPPDKEFEGPCRAALERSFETTDWREIALGTTDTTLGGSWAASLMRCLSDHCSDCLHATDGGRDAQTDTTSEGGARPDATSDDASREAK